MTENLSVAPTDYLRNGDLRELLGTLQDHRTRALDIVAPLNQVTVRDGAVILDNHEPVLLDNGVQRVDGAYKPTRVGIEGLSSTLDIPVKYMRRMESEHLALFDGNVNGWLHHESNTRRKALLRLLVHPAGDPGTDGFDGVVRAVLSDTYKTIDNFDVLMASLRGMQAAGIADPIITGDLTERRMVVRVVAPQVAVYAPELLKDYRNPFGDGNVPQLPGWTPERVARAAGIEGLGYKPGEEPVLFAGFEIANSETGHGAFTITPRLEVRICRNGLTITAEMTRKVHLGERLDAGVVQWSDDTREKNLALITAQTRDVVTRFVTPSFVQGEAAKLAEKAGHEVKPSDAKDVIVKVAKPLRWTQAEQDSILNHFMAGGQYTTGGVMQAVTATAQTLSGDAAYEMERQGVLALSHAASVVR